MRKSKLTAGIQKEWRDETRRYVTVDEPGVLGARSDVVETASRLGLFDGDGSPGDGRPLPSQSATLEEGEPGFMLVLFSSEQRLSATQLASLGGVARR